MSTLEQINLKSLLRYKNVFVYTVFLDRPLSTLKLKTQTQIFFPFLLLLLLPCWLANNKIVQCSQHLARRVTLTARLLLVSAG